jgi:hypothetical protein
VSPARVEVHIEELVLHGLPPVDGNAVGEALQRELVVLLEDTGSVTPSHARDSAPSQGSGFSALSLTPDALGVEIAKAVHRTWKA